MPSHLAVSDNDQYVILFRLADDGNGFIDNWRKRGWPRELHEWSDFRISGQDLSGIFKAMSHLRRESEHVAHLNVLHGLLSGKKGNTPLSFVDTSPGK